MKTYLIRLFTFIFLLTSCIPAPLSTPPSVVDNTQTPVVATSAITTATTIPSPTVAITPKISTPTFIPAPLPDDLIFTYIAEDGLWVWKQGNSALLVQQQNIYMPRISDDGQWILFAQRLGSRNDGERPFDELWIVRTDGSELHRLLGKDDLIALTGEEAALFIYDADWISESQTILFNTEKVIDGPPGSVPLFDLYSLEITGQVKRLAEAGSGGKFRISPTGTHVALTTNTRIAVLDLRNGEQRTLLDYKPLQIPSEITFIARVVWDPQGKFVMTSIPPEKFHYSDYAGEPVQVWRLFVNGQKELITEFQPSFRDLGVSVSPNAQYVLYLDESCFPKTGMLTVHEVTSTSKTSLFCTWNLPRWTPDNEHFYFQADDGLWQIGSISSPAYQPLDVLNVPTAPNIHIPQQLIWVNDEYFLLVLRSIDMCTLNIATLEGIVTEITRTPPDKCPWNIDFSFPKQ